MKRLRLYALATTVVLVAVIALAGGSYLRGGTAHADAGGMAPGQIPFDAISHYHVVHGNLPSLNHSNGPNRPADAVYNVKPRSYCFLASHEQR
jgi:hypothetical protein